MTTYPILYLPLNDQICVLRKNVSEISSEYKKIFSDRIVHIDNCVSGKNDALNKLFRLASNLDAYIFMDADIMLKDGDVLPNLIKNITIKGYHLASAFVKAYDMKYSFPFNHLASIYNKRLPSRYKHAKYANGRLFAIQGDELRKISKDGDIFPSKYILDDMYIGIHIDWEKIIMDINAEAYMVYFNSFRDYISFKTAKRRGSLFLEKEYPELYLRRKKDFATVGIGSLSKTSDGIDHEVNELLTFNEKIIAMIEKYVLRKISENSVDINHKFSKKTGKNRHCQDNTRLSTKKSFVNA